MQSPYKSIISLAIPLSVGQISIILLAFADTIMVGHYGTASLAASAFVNNLFNLVIYVVTGYSYGTTPLISQHYGRGEHYQAGQTLRHAMRANLGFGFLAIAVMGVLFFFLDFMGQPDELMPLVKPYYLTVLASMVFMVPFLALRQLTDGITDTSVAMWILMGCVALNILGNWLLIFGPGPFPEWGLLGAGISTLFSRIVGLLALLLIIYKRKKYKPYRLGFMARVKQEGALRRIHKISFPISLQIGMETFSFSAVTIMAGWLGTMELAGLQIIMTLSTLSFMLYSSFASAAAIRIATFHGSGHVSAVNANHNAGIRLLIGLSFFYILVFYFGGAHILQLFTDDSDVLRIGISLLPLLAIYQIVDALQMGYAHALRGIARVESIIAIAAVSYIFTALASSYVMCFVCDWGLKGLFGGLSLGLVAAALLLRLTFRRGLREWENKIMQSTGHRT